MTVRQESMIKKIISLGLEVEDLMNWNKPIGKKASKAKAIINKLKSQGIDVYSIDYSYTDENGYEWCLEHALQFV